MPISIEVNVWLYFNSFGIL